MWLYDAPVDVAPAEAWHIQALPADGANGAVTSDTGVTVSAETVLGDFVEVGSRRFLCAVRWSALCDIAGGSSWPSALLLSISRAGAWQI